MASEQQLLNVIFDDGSSPQEKANAVQFLKKIVKKDRDALVAQFLNPTINPAKRKRSPPRERARPQDAKRIKELEDKIEELEAIIDKLPALIKLFCKSLRSEFDFVWSALVVLFWVGVIVWIKW